MKVATWNVNSVKARHERLLAFLEREAPDVLCLQELKVTDDKFPAMEVGGLGYRAAVLGQKTYNGVAILAKETPEDAAYGLDDGFDDPQARLVAATVGGVRILSAYFPNGGAVGSDKYEYKLQWMSRLRKYLDKHHRPDAPLLLCGDFNVAPDDLDINRLDEWKNTSLTTSEVRAALESIRAFGLVDVVRKHHPDGQLYSWWDYRMLGFPKNNGLRIDHIFATEMLANKCTEARVDRDERKGKLPSDHAPVICTFDLA